MESVKCIKTTQQKELFERRIQNFTRVGELGWDNIQLLKGKKTKEPFVNYKSFHIFSRFFSSVIFADTSFFSSSQKLHALFPTLRTLPEKLNYITIHPSADSTGHHIITQDNHGKQQSTISTLHSKTSQD